MKFLTPLPLSEIAQAINATQVVGSATINATGINEIHKVEKGDITFVDVEKYYQKAFRSAASIIIINQEITAPEGKTLLVCEQPFEAYNLLVKKHRPFRPLNSLISPSAHIHPSAIIEPNVIIGPNVRIGKRSYIQANVTIREYTNIGDQVVIQSGSIIGADAFYFHKKEKSYKKWRSGGRVIIEDQVDIGPGCTICKGVSGDTIIGTGTKLDAQIHIGHGVEIGQNCLLAAQVGIGGKTVIGDEVILYGQVGIAPRLKIANKVTVLAKSGVSKNLKAATTYFGYPAREVSLQYKALAALRMLPDLLKTKTLLLLFFGFIVALSACVEHDNKLLLADKKAIDTLTANTIRSIEPMLDSLCISNKDSIKKIAIDSILLARKKQEERLRNREIKR